MSSAQELEATAANATVVSPAHGDGGSLITTYVAIVTMACACVYWGSIAALGQMGKREPNKGEEDDESDGATGGWEVEKSDTMTRKDAMKFPLVGSVVLVSLYTAFKYLPKELLNNVLTAYFLFFGLFAIAWTMRPLFWQFLSSKQRKSILAGKRTVHLKPAFVFGDEPLQLDSLDGVTLALAVVMGAFYWQTKNWILSNVLGLAFSIQGIAMLNLGSVQTGCILLSGLFFYDIWWVFGTEVMVTVAKSFDVPIKLLFPRDLFGSWEPKDFSMLGLGDIVIPGIFVALLLRFDAHRAMEAKYGKKTDLAQKRLVPRQFPTPYFKSVYLGYFAGLATTIVVMHVFRAAQPALLYLVPSCLGSAFLCALVRGELSQLWTYSEEESDEEKKAKADAKAKDEKKKD